MRIRWFIVLSFFITPLLSISSPQKGIIFSNDGSISGYAWFDNDGSFHFTQQPPPNSCSSIDCLAIHSFLEKELQQEALIREKADADKKREQEELIRREDTEKREKEKQAKAELNSAREDGYKYGYSVLGKSFTKQGQSRYCLSEALSYMQIARKRSKRSDFDFNGHSDYLIASFRFACESGASKAAIKFGNFE